MRLLNCVSCHDILSVLSDWRYCSCGRSASRYIKDTSAIEVLGSAKIIEIDDREYKNLLQNSRAKFDCKYAIVDGFRIQRAKLPI